VDRRIGISESGFHAELAEKRMGVIRVVEKQPDAMGQLLPLIFISCVEGG
jgi:hypothetical protein